MRKRVISVCIAAILIPGIFGCTRTAEDALVAEMENVETENIAAENEEEKDSEGEEADTDDTVYIMHDNGELEEIDRTQLENEIPMSDEVKAMEMGYSQANTIADIKDITWEAVDYNVVDLHFNLEDGSAVDKEIVAYSVQDIVYEDVTGDDADEVLIYCDFANNTCDWQWYTFIRLMKEM